MKKILKTARKIRDNVNKANLYDKCFKKHIDDWNIICVAMDTLEDSCLALLDFESKGFGKNDGNKYLRLYGFFQAIILQQDSINNLYKIFLKKKLKTKKSAWKQLRDLRNLTTGHPINYGEFRNDKKVKRCFISRITINNKGFQLIIWNKEKGKDDFKNIDLNLIYGQYKSEAIKYLQEIYNVQKK